MSKENDMQYIMIDQHKKHIKNRRPTRSLENAFATMVGLTVWLMLFSVMGWTAVTEPQPPMRPYLAYPEKNALLQNSKDQMAKADRAFIDEMEIRGRIKTKEAKK
jgi:hypothetical protein